MSIGASMAKLSASGGWRQNESYEDLRAVLIWMHFLAAILAITLGSINLASKKGTFRHRVIGWCWIVVMLAVTLPSFWIRELREGSFSWIHILTVVTLVSMMIAIVSIRRGNVKRHARAMIGTMVGALIAGAFALMPGRLLSIVLGYG